MPRLSPTPQRPSESPFGAVVGIDTGLHVCGVEPGHAAVDIAQAVERLDSLAFAGFATYEGRLSSDDHGQLADKSRDVASMLVDTKKMAEESGLNVEVLSAGGTA